MSESLFETGKMIDYAAARRGMVDTQLRTSAVTDRRVLTAMETVERERFVPGVRRELAYIDDEHPVGAARPQRYIAAPTPIARLIQLLDPHEDAAVLVVAANTGYSAAVLARLARSVVALEADPELAGLARDNLAELPNVRVVEGQLDAGADEEGPFDAILVEGAVDAVPEALFRQLREGGRLVALIRQGATGVAHLYVRTGEGIATRAEFNASLPMLEIVKREQQFVF